MPQRGQPSHLQLLYSFGSGKLGTGSGLSLGPSFPLEFYLQVSGEKGSCPHSAKAHGSVDGTGLGRDLGSGLVSASTELCDLGRNLLFLDPGFLILMSTEFLPSSEAWLL